MFTGMTYILSSCDKHELFPVNLSEYRKELSVSIVSFHVKSFSSLQYVCMKSLLFLSYTRKFQYDEKNNTICREKNKTAEETSFVTSEPVLTSTLVLCEWTWKINYRLPIIPSVREKNKVKITRAQVWRGETRRLKEENKLLTALWPFHMLQLAVICLASLTLLPWSFSFLVNIFPCKGITLWD